MTLMRVTHVLPDSPEAALLGWDAVTVTARNAAVVRDVRVVAGEVFWKPGPPAPDPVGPPLPAAPPHPSYAVAAGSGRILLVVGGWCGTPYLTASPDLRFAYLAPSVHGYAWTLNGLVAAAWWALGAAPARLFERCPDELGVDSPSRVDLNAAATAATRIHAALLALELGHLDRVMRSLLLDVKSALVAG